MLDAPDLSKEKPPAAPEKEEVGDEYSAPAPPAKETYGAPAEEVLYLYKIHSCFSVRLIQR